MSRLVLVVFLAFGLFLDACAEETNYSLSELMQRAAAGDAKAQFYFGDRYRRGEGLSQDFRQAATWYAQAAEQGYADAQEALGVLYGNGQGVSQDFQQAAYWTRKAAEQGHTGAQSTLGDMYAMGWGVPKDWVLAYALLYLAAEKGDTHATLIRGRIVTEMTPEQIREGKAIASQWKVGQTFPTESKTGRMNPPPITPEP